VAWREGSIGSEIVVSHYNGSNWRRVGDNTAGANISNTDGTSLYPSLGLGSDDQPIVAWSDDDPGSEQIYVRRFDGADWIEVGASSATMHGISDSAGSAKRPSLVVDDADMPIVAWLDTASGRTQVYAAGFDGVAWSEVSPGAAIDGGISQTSLTPGAPCLARGASGELAVAWSSSGEIYVRRLEATAWVELGQGQAAGGGLSDSAGSSLWPVVAMGPDGYPVVAWSDDSPGNLEIYTLRFDGEAWQEIGAGSASGRGISDTGARSYSPSLALGSGGQPVIAWQEMVGEVYQVYALEYAGGVWAEVEAGSASGAGIAGTSMSSKTPSVAIDRNGARVVAWSESSATLGHQIHVLRSTGSGWAEVRDGSASADGISNNWGSSARYPAMVINPAGDRVVTWAQSTDNSWQIMAIQYNDHYSLTEWSFEDAWLAPDGISDSSGDSWEPTVAMNSAEDYFVAWHDNTPSQSQIYAKRHDGNDWQPAGTGAASGQGLSQSAGFARYPAMAVDSNGRPVLAWMDTGSGRGQIYVRRLEGEQWLELGAGSGSGNGISGSGAGVGQPSVATGAGFICVTWFEVGQASQQIVLRCGAQ